jgi:hypothetical protein
MLVIKFCLCIQSETHKFVLIKVPSRKVSTFVPFLQKILYIRDSCPLRKFTIITTISTMFCTNLTLHWYTHDSRPTLSQAGIVLNH